MTIISSNIIQNKKLQKYFSLYNNILKNVYQTLIFII